MRYLGLGFLGIMLVGAATSGSAQIKNAASAQLAQLFADDWANRLQENPLFATFLGDNRANDQLPKVSLADARQRNAQTRGFLDRLLEIDRSQLTPAEQVNYDIFKRQKENSLRSFALLDYLMPITNREGFHISFPQLPERLTFKNVKDYQDYISRLNGFPAYTAGHIELMRAGIRQGRVLPKIVLQGIDGSITPHIVDSPEKSLLYAPFAKFPESIPAGEQSQLAAAGGRAIMQSVVPAYRNFLAFLQNEYIPAAPDTIAATAMPDGEALYQFYIEQYTTLKLTARQIHEIGLSEVRRIRGEMLQILHKLEFAGTLPEFIQFLRTDPRFYVDSPEALLKETALVLKKMDGKLPELFKTLPRMPYGIRPIPDFIAPKTTTAYYSQPSGDGRHAGYYNVNLYDLRSRPLYEIEALSFHEAVPGHHLQLALQQEMTGLPMFRRFGGFTAFVEGWALYAERLGLEVGFYRDPYSDFGRLTYEMWRACRLVVDTGMHALGWTRQRAIDYMADNTALTLLNITNEVDRYIAWPGQALAYKLGQMKISELRRMAETTLGARFDEREFHDVVLGSGAVPLDVLEANVQAWVASVKAEPLK